MALTERSLVLCTSVGKLGWGGQQVRDYAHIKAFGHTCALVQTPPHTCLAFIRQTAQSLVPTLRELQETGPTVSEVQACLGPSQGIRGEPGVWHAPREMWGGHARWGHSVSKDEHHKRFKTERWGEVVRD